MKKKVWFVTGASKGLGLTLVKELLDKGYSVAATSRNKARLEKEAGLVSDRFFAIQADLSEEESIRAAVRSSFEHFGQLDVVVNNAGYGIGGAIEELSQEEIMESFNINVFATLHVIKAVMPYLREQRSGHIINISSIAGFAAATGWAIYAAAKFAVVGLSEVLAEDVKEFGIHVTVVEPGAFRTSFLSGESLVLAKQPIGAYNDVRASHARYTGFHGVQAGDPAKAAAAFIQLAETAVPPVRLFLGSDAYQRASQKLELIKTDLENWKMLTLSTDFNS
ncbi:oxidoreductase [Ferruginibacter sp. HRS2-29]|uniref:oxidoreductase n=1 Tax=Ferruginibacter sp. HRS2-29 TaxID=2487334 RepID=UPI0020CE6828|nr:oxidoreductase [Ferruginibacter sp. HRS2-29]MCP9751219.1 SDR family NAD(P)-dependent oxidoreductase [Ferruginibacter sp. HRS2-29]